MTGVCTSFNPRGFAFLTAVNEDSVHELFYLHVSNVTPRLPRNSSIAVGTRIEFDPIDAGRDGQLRQAMNAEIISTPAAEEQPAAGES